MSVDSKLLTYVWKLSKFYHSERATTWQIISLILHWSKTTCNTWIDWITQLLVTHYTRSAEFRWSWTIRRLRATVLQCPDVRSISYPSSQCWGGKLGFRLLRRWEYWCRCCHAKNPYWAPARSKWDCMWTLNSEHQVVRHNNDSSTLEGNTHLCHIQIWVFSISFMRVGKAVNLTHCKQLVPWWKTVLPTNWSQSE